MCDSIHGILPTREVHPSLGIQSPHWGLGTYTWLTTHMTDPKFAAPLEAELTLLAKSPYHKS